MTDDVVRELEVLKREVDALQIEVMSGIRPWYKQVSSLVALAALAFSFGTTAVSSYRTAQQDLLASRLELRSLVEKLTEIPREHARMLKEFGDEPQVIAELSASMNSRNLVLAKQSMATIERIEDSWFGRGSVLAMEYGTVGTALVNSYQFEEAEVYHREASRRATDPASAAGAFRSVAGVAMARGDVAAARGSMAEARAIFDDGRFRSTVRETRDVTNAHTEIQWGQMELQAGDCEESAIHASNAQELVAQVSGGSMKARLHALLVDLRTAWLRCQGGS